MSEQSVRAAAVGDLLAGRHRLQRPVSSGPFTTVWRAVDEVLARPVAVKMLDGSNDARAFLEAAILAGRVSHPRVASVYDAVEEDGLVFVVSEWVEGASLAELLTDGPLPPERAANLVHQAAQALAVAHEAGVAHRRLHPGNVLVGASGSVKLTDLEVAAAVYGQEPGGEPRQADARALGALLYAALTARWPLSVRGQGHDHRLPAQPAAHGRLVSPRQIRAGIPRDLDAVAVRILDPDAHPGAARLDTPSRVAQALRAQPGVRPASAGGVAREGRLRGSRRALRWAVPIAALVGIGVGGWVAGLHVGRVPGAQNRFPDLLASASAGPGQTAAPAPVALPAVRDYDPEGDGQERPDEVSLSHDGDTSTAWETVTYRHDPKFGGLKNGVGLLVDFGTPQRVSEVSLALTAPGASLELHAGDRLGDDIGALPTVARISDSDESVTLRPSKTTTARYWVVWITLLPPGSGGFQEGIAEMVFRG